MANRIWRKRLPWLALPLVVLAVMLVVRYKSPLFEGRRWLLEQGQSAVKMQVYASVRSAIASPGTERQELNTTNREDIQNLLGVLDCKGSLSGKTHLPLGWSEYGWQYDITLSYLDGRTEFLTLYQRNGNSDLVRYSGSLFGHGESVLGNAYVGPSAYSAFEREFLELKPKSVQ